ncbi:MAG: NUDIX domain-containing protein [Chloroflexota bacterium]
MNDHPQDADESEFLAAYDPSAYAHTSVAVDVVLLTVADGGLRTLLLRRAGQPAKDRWALPGGFVAMDESLDAAAGRVLAEKAGLDGVFIEQLYTFGEPGRDPRTRVISVVYYALVEPGRLERAVAERADQRLALAAVDVQTDGGGHVHSVRALDAAGRELPMAFDHARILTTAVERIRGKLDYAPIGFELLPERFTLLELRRVHESILGRPLNKDSFRRKVIDRGLVEPTGERATGLGHRPPELYRFARPTGAAL